MQPAQLAKVIQRYEKLVLDGLSIKVDKHEITSSIPRMNSSNMNPAFASPPPPRVRVEESLDEAECRTWVVRVGAALADIFPERHAVRSEWGRIFQNNPNGPYNYRIKKLLGVLKGALDLLREGFGGTLIESIQAETLGELLDLADGHLAQGDLVVAVGIAGGVLETHLRHLVDRHGITVQGHGSIERYNNLIGQERKAGKEIYSLGDQKLVTTWGDSRNIADHTPLSFTKSREEVSLMLQGIRNFLSRVP